MVSSLLALFISCAITGATEFRVQSVTPGERVLTTEPIHVVFSQPVIAFGSDLLEIPKEKQNPLNLKVFRGRSSGGEEIALEKIGRWRYITTSIARFNLNEELNVFRWPTDTYVVVEENLSLLSALGEPLVSTLKATSWQTASLSWGISNVLSGQARELSDGGWTPQVYGEDGYAEVPDDGILQITFSQDVDLGLISLPGFMKCGSRDILVQTPCFVGETKEGNDRCYNATLSSPLGFEERCSPSLASDALYHPLSGPTKNVNPDSYYVNLIGLVSFKFGPFLSFDYIGARSLRLRMYVRHGLSKSIDLSSQVSVSPSLDGGLTVSVPEKFMVLLEGNFKPETSYSVSIRGSDAIRDEFGLPLVGSEGKVPMAAKSSQFIQYEGSRVIHMHPDDDMDAWPIAARLGQEPVTISACPVSSSEVEGIISELWSGYSDKDISSLCSSSQTVNLENSGTSSIPLPPTSSKLWLAAVTRTFSGYTERSYKLLSNADLHVAVFKSQRTDEPDEVDVVVTSLTTGEPVEAAVELWDVGYNEAARVSNRGSVEGGSVKLASAGTEYYDQHVVVVKAGDAIFVVDSFLYLTGSVPRSRSPLRAVVTTDRSFYTPGDEVLFTGWLYDPECSCVNGDVSTAKLEIFWSPSTRYSNPTDDSRGEVEVSLDEFGTFRTTLVVPSSAEYGARPDISLSLQSNEELSVSVSAAGFLISDPRLPTATMAMEAPSFLLTSASELTVKASVETLTGIPLEGVLVTFRLSQTLPKNCYSDPDTEISVSATFKTLASGISEATFNLQADGFTLDHASQIFVSTSATGPTGELLGKTDTVSITQSVFSLGSVSPSVSPPLPDQYFVASTSARRAHGDGGNPVVTEAGFDVIEQKCSDIQVSSIGGAPCSVEGNEITCAEIKFTSASEELSLVVSATIEGDIIWSCLDIAQPLITSWTQSLSLTADSTSVEVGQQAEIRFWHPYKGEAAKMWAAWGTGKTDIMDLDPAVSSHDLKITITEAMGASVGVQVYVWVPLPSSSLNALPSGDAKISKTIPEWGPRTARAHLSLSISTAQRQLESSIAVALPEEAQPGETVNLDVEVSEGGPGVAYVTVVDQSVFELEPLALPTTGGFFAEDKHVSSIIEKYLDVTSGRMMEEAASIFGGIFVRDPYISPYWSSLWLDGNYEDIVASSDFQESITEGNFPFYYRFPSYLDSSARGRISFCPTSPVYGNPSPFARGGEFLQFAALEADFAADSVAAASAGIGFGNSAKLASPPPAAPAAAPALREGVQTERLVFAGKVQLVDGKGSIEIEMPLDRKKFSVRVHVVSDPSSGGQQVPRYGSSESFVSVTSPVYLQGYTPRALRLTDRPAMGAVVQVDPSGPYFGKEAVVAVENISQEYTLEDESRTSETLSLDTSSVYAVFPLIVIGEPSEEFATMDLSLSVEGSIVDRVRLSLAIDPHAHPVLMGTSRAIAAPGSWTDVISLPYSIKSASEIQLRASVSQYPSIVAACQRSAYSPLASALESETEIRAHVWVAVGYCASVLLPEDIPSLNSPVVLGSAPAAIDKLFQDYTDSEGNLWYTSDKSRWKRYGNLYTDFDLLTSALLMSRLTSSTLSGSFGVWSGRAQKYLRDLRERSRDHDLSWLAAELWLAVGSDSSLEIPPEYSSFSDFKAKVEEEGNLNSRLMMNAAEGAVNQDLIDLLMGNLRISSDQTGYIARSAELSALSDPWQALGLLSISQSSATANDERTWRVAVYIGQGGESQICPWLSSWSGKTLIYVGMSLTKFDEMTWNSNPAVSVSVSSDSGELWSTRLNQGQRADQTSWDIAGDAYEGPISWNADGEGTVYSFLSATLVPVAPWPAPISRGFFVQKLIQKLDLDTGLCAGPMVTEAVSGEIVCVTIQASSPDDVRSVSVIDWSPSGLEPLDDELAAISEALSAIGANEGVEVPGIICPFWWGFCRVFEDKKTSRSSVVFDLKGFLAGSRSFTYLALANIAGRYALPAAKVEDSDNPTYLGLSGSSEFVVQPKPSTINHSVTKRLIGIPVEQARKRLLGEGGGECPGVNSEGGWCDRGTGLWMCGQVACADQGESEGSRGNETNAGIDPDYACGESNLGPTLFVVLAAMMLTIDN